MADMRYLQRSFTFQELNNHRLKPAGSYYGLKVRIRVDSGSILKLSLELSSKWCSKYCLIISSVICPTMAQK